MPARSRRALSGGTRIWLVFTLLLILLGVSTALWPGTPPGAQQSPHRGFDLQAHRGARCLMPENTLPAFEKALALGVTTLELDAVMTADGVVGVHHDRRLAPERRRNAAGNWIAEADAPAILSLSASNLATYDIGHARPGSRYADHWPEQAAVTGRAEEHTSELQSLMRFSYAVFRL